MLSASGIGSYLRGILPPLVSRARGCAVSFLGDPRDAGLLPAQTVRRVRWIRCASPLYSAAEQIELPRRIPRDADLFWTPHYVHPLLWRGPLAATVHDVAHLVLAGGVRRAYAAPMFYALARRARGILFVSETTRREFCARVGKPRGDSAVVGNGVGREWFRVRRFASRVPYFLFVGNVKPHKNLGTLLEALRRVGERLPHRLLVAGREEGLRFRDRTARRIAAALGGRVRFLGRVDDAELRRLVAGADALVFPSLYEGFGLPPLEAMAAGCPVACSGIPPMAEILPSDAALFFDPRDPEALAASLIRLSKDRGLRARLVQAGRRAARRHRWKDAARRTWEFLAGLI